MIWIAIVHFGCLAVFLHLADRAPLWADQA